MPNERQRRAAEQRRQRRQNQRRYQRYQRRRRLMTIGTVIGVVAIVALVVTFIVVTHDEKSTPSAKGPSTSTSASPSASPSSSAAGQARYPCTWTKAATAARPVNQPADVKPALAGTLTIAVTTNRGPMTFVLDRALAPCAVESVVSLIGQNFYDATPCFRLTTASIYVLQCGDPTGTGKGGPGYTINDEAGGDETYPSGTIAMARGQAADSAGSQFFIVYKDSPGLRQNLGTRQYTIIGKVTKGLSVVQKVAAGGATGTGGDGKPKLPLTIKSMAVR